jgi:hypothetical protein
MAENNEEEGMTLDRAGQGRENTFGEPFLDCNVLHTRVYRYALSGPSTTHPTHPPIYNIERVLRNLREPSRK